MKDIIFDTDIGTDCDDAGALAMIHSLCELGECKLLGVTACHKTSYIGGCIDAINTYYKRCVPIGINRERIYPDEKTTYDKALATEFNRSFSDEDFPDSISLLRKLLADAKDNSITLVVTGMLSNMARLIRSEPDEISPLNGRELVEKKVERTVVMGGRFTETWPFRMTPHVFNEVTSEWNIMLDIDAARIFTEEWVGEVIFSSFEIGVPCITLSDVMTAANESNPVRRAYLLHPHGKNGRSSWDLTAVLYAVRPDGGYYYTTPYGQVSVDEVGVTTFVDGEGLHRYLLPRLSYKRIADEIDSLVKSSPLY